jgi:isomerase DpgB
VSTVIIEGKNHTIVKTEITGGTSLSNELIVQLTNALDQAESIGLNAVLLIHVVGEVNSACFLQWPGQTSTQSIGQWERILRRIERTAVTTVALLVHFCSAMALELLSVTDRRFGNDHFTVQPAALGGSIWPSMAIYRLSRQIGEARARKLYLDGIEITAALAADLGLIDEVIEDFASGLDRIIYFLTNAPLDDFAIRRRLMQDSLSISFDDALGLHLAACDRALRRSSASDQEIGAPRDQASFV